VIPHRDPVSDRLAGLGHLGHLRAQTGIIHPQSEEELAVVGHGEPALYELPFGRRLEDQTVSGVEHPREDRQPEGRLVVGGRVEDGRGPDPVDEPHGRVVQVRIEDQGIGI